MIGQAYQGSISYPVARLSTQAAKNFRRRTTVWRQTMPLQVFLWLLIPGLAALGALYKIQTAPFYRTVVFAEAFLEGLWCFILILPFLILFYAVQWRRVMAPLGAIGKTLRLNDESISMECMPYNSQNLGMRNGRYKLYPREQQCRERTRINVHEVEAIHYYPECDCVVVYGPVHFVATKGFKKVKEGILTGKYGYRVYCGHENLRQFAKELSTLSSIPVSEMPPRSRIPVEKQCKIWLI